MIVASDVRAGDLLKLDGRLFRVVEAEHHKGAAQMTGFVHLKLRDLQSGHLTERRFRNSDKLENVMLEKRHMDYLYQDAEAFCFMDPESYEQFSIPKQAIGHLEKFLKEGMRVAVELCEGQAVSVDFPKVVELKITMTPPGIRQGQENTMKMATLENGMEILVPQFVNAGEVVRVDTETGKYLERVSSKRG